MYTTRWINKLVVRFDLNQFILLNYGGGNLPLGAHTSSWQRRQLTYPRLDELGFISDIKKIFRRAARSSSELLCDCDECERECEEWF